MLNKLIAALTTAGLLCVATIDVARAQHGPGGGHHDPLFEGVTLTDAQQTQVAALRKASWQADHGLFEQMHAIDRKIDTALLSSGTVTEATLAPLVQQKTAVMQQLENARLTEQVAMRNLLTDTQLSQAASAHAQLESLRAQERALHAGPADLPPAD